MRTTILKRAWGAFGLAHFVPQSRWAIVMLTLLLATANLFAIPTGVTVATLGGGNPNVKPKYLGYSDGITLSQALFHTPSGIALDNTGQYLFLADRDNNAIRFLDLDAGYTWTFDVTYTNLINKPIAVAIDTYDYIYVLNRGNTNNGSVITFDGWGDAVVTNAVKLTNAAGMALDGFGNIYVTVKSNKLIRIAAYSTNQTVIPANFPAGTSLQGIVVKHNGLIAACDSGRNGIYLINPTNGIVSTNAGFHGAGDFTTNGNNIASGTTAKFRQPMNVVETGDGSLIVTDYGNNRIKRVLTGGVVTNLYGVASNYWGGSFPGWYDGSVQVPDSTAPNVQSRMPVGVAIAQDGTIYTTEDYYHIIRHVTGGNFLPPPPPPPPPPPQVTGLTATPGYGQVSLTWNTSAGATNYNVKRGITSGAYTIIATPVNTSFVDTNVLDGTNYYYVVSAQNASSESANSSEASAIPLFSPTPTNLVVTAVTYGLPYGYISLAWSPSAGATRYNVKRSTSSGTYNPPYFSATGISYTDTNAVNGTTYYYVISAVNSGGENPVNSAEVSATPPLPPVAAPQIGYLDIFGSFHSVSLVAFNNDVPIVIEGEAGTQTYYTYGNTLIVTNVTDPASAPHTQAQNYPGGGIDPAPYTLTFSGGAKTLPQLTIKAIGEQNGRSNSAVVAARFEFIVADPLIVGANAAQFAISNITVGAQMYYTTDGNNPNPTNSDTFGPITNGTTLSLQILNGTNLDFRIMGFKDNYQPSPVVTNVFSITNYLANTISFGFGGVQEASSAFIASAGQTFYAPVTLSPLSGVQMYSLQFNLVVTNAGPNPGPAIASGAYDFTSMLLKTMPDGTYETILPYMCVGSGTNAQPASDPGSFRAYGGDWYESLMFINTNENLMGVGWVEEILHTNLYNTLGQDLIQYSAALNDLFVQGGGKVILGGYSFNVPTNAITNQTYRIQIGRPSATSDGIGAPGSDVLIDAPLTHVVVNGQPVSALEIVTIGQIKYLVGGVYPFRWFNAGDFGTTNIVSPDVQQVFGFAVYGGGGGLPSDTDLFDAMDSCGNIGILDTDNTDPNNGYYTNAAVYPTPYSYPVTNYTYYLDTNNMPFFTNLFVFWRTAPITMTTTFVDTTFTVTYINYLGVLPVATNIVRNPQTTPYSNPNVITTLFDGNDTNINQIVFGDGRLDVCDVYVTYRRSLDPGLTWFRRFWNYGQRVADTGLTNHAAALVSKILNPVQSKALSSGTSTVAPLVNFAAGDITNCAGGQTVQVPINATIYGDYPLRVLMLNLTVTPLDGSPALTSAVQFTPNPALGALYTSASKGNGNYSAVWLNSAIGGLTGTAYIGTLSVTIPAGAPASAAYAVHFDHASASPNGLGSFPKQTFTGLITRNGRTTSTYGDGIPDSWRLRWFGTVNDLLSVSNACPSGDGVDNWQKYVAGVDPNVANNFPCLNARTPAPSGSTMAIHWPTVSGKQYVILRSASIFPGNWTAISTNTGTGMNMEFDDTNPAGAGYYRVQILP